MVNRYSYRIINAYRKGVLRGLRRDDPPMSVCLDYYNTVNSNIELFLKDKTKRMEFNLGNSRQDFERFWSLIGAQGDLDVALLEFDTAWNASVGKEGRPTLPMRILRKVGRTFVKLPNFVKDA